VLKRWSIFTVVFSLLFFLAAGCGQSTSDGDKTGGQDGGTGNNKVTITFMHLWPEGVSAGQNRIVNQIIESYQDEHPNVTIKQTVLDNEQYKNQLKILSASKQLPDVGVTWAAGFMQPYVAGNLFASLDDILKEGLADRFIAGTTEAFSVGTSTYALPLEFNVAPIYYNRKLFSQYNLDVPETYSEFKQVVQTLAKNGIAPIALGNKDRWTGSLWYMYLADRIAGQDMLAKAIRGEASFADEQMLRAAQEVQALVDANAFVRGFNGLSNEEAKSEFLNEKAAMYLMGTWDLPNFTTNEDIPKEFRDNVGFFKFPTVEGGRGNIDSWVGGPGVGLFVSELSKVKDEAKAFVKYFIEKWGEEAVTGAGVIPATKVDTSNLDLPQLFIDVLGEMNKASSVTLYADVQMEAADAEVHLNQIQALFGKSVTPEQFARAHDQAVSD